MGQKRLEDLFGLRTNGLSQPGQLVRFLLRVTFPCQVSVWQNHVRTVIEDLPRRNASLVLAIGIKGWREVHLRVNRRCEPVFLGYLQDAVIDVTLEVLGRMHTGFDGVSHLDTHGNVPDHFQSVRVGFIDDSHENIVRKPIMCFDRVIAVSCCFSDSSARLFFCIHRDCVAAEIAGIQNSADYEHVRCEQLACFEQLATLQPPWPTIHLSNRRHAKRKMQEIVRVIVRMNVHIRKARRQILIGAVYAGNSVRVGSHDTVSNPIDFTVAHEHRNVLSNRSGHHVHKMDIGDQRVCRSQFPEFEQSFLC